MDSPAGPCPECSLHPGSARADCADARGSFVVTTAKRIPDRIPIASEGSGRSFLRVARGRRKITSKSPPADRLSSVGSPCKPALDRHGSPVCGGGVNGPIRLVVDRLVLRVEPLDAPPRE